MDAASERGVPGSGHGTGRPDDRGTVNFPASLPANYEHTTEIIKNMTEVLATLIEGMRPMNESHWKRLAETLEVRQGLRSAFIEWKAEGERLKSIAPLDFLEAIEELTEDQRPQLPSAHRQSA